MNCGRARTPTGSRRRGSSTPSMRSASTGRPSTAAVRPPPRRAPADPAGSPTTSSCSAPSPSTSRTRGSTPSWSPWVLEVLDIVFGGRDEVRRRRPYSFLDHAGLAARHRGGLHRQLAGAARLGHPRRGAADADDGLHVAGKPAGHRAPRELRDARHALPGSGGGAGDAVHRGSAAGRHGSAQGRYTSNTYHPVLSAACTEMARHYGLPVMGSGGGTDAFVPGAQAGYEKAVELALRARSRGRTCWSDPAASAARWSSASSRC